MQKVAFRQASIVIVMAFIFFFILGALVVTNVQAQSHTFKRTQDWDWDWDDDWDRHPDKIYPEYRYNRVEGLFLGMKVDADYWRYRRPSSPFVFGSAGYAFAAKELEYQIGIEQGFMERSRFAIGAEYHRQIDSPDRWIIGDEENSLAALLIKEDFMDFYLKEGGSIYISQALGRDLKLKAFYSYDRLDSLDRYASWSLFGKDKKFRPNPAMDAGDIRTIGGNITFDTRNNTKRTTRGWFATASYEKADPSMGGIFGFERLETDIRRFQSLGFDQGLDIRIRVGTATGHMPWQKSYQLGGISTVRAFRYKSLSGGPLKRGGNRMILAQIEYRLGEGYWPEDLDLGLFDLFNFIVFADAGWVGFVDENLGLFEGFKGLKMNDFKSDIGIALANASGSVRIEVARRTDTNHRPFRFYFRINRPF
ncbi:BamA/TamA family outer membrane protein [bacterium]|nr:BamA/TamA family outer membrane protein [bacterium]